MSSEMKNPKDSLTLLPCFYFVELPIVASSMVSLYFLELTDVVQPAQVGFRCRDRELSMPYVDSGDELIPLLMLLSLAFSGPAASIMVVEALVYCLQSRLKLLRAEGSITAGGCNFNSFLRRTVRFVGVHVFGLCATALLTDVIQLSTGYHAPFFLTVCKPNYTMATGGSCDGNAYITKDICSGPDQHAILTARKTFPSQHATLSAFAAVYVSMYFNATISDSTKLLKPVLVFAFAIAAALTGLTQITQHRSHPIDVYAGFLIGAFVAGYLAFHAVGNFQSSDDITAVAPPPLKADALKALTERGHDSVYNKGPASASESHDDITAPGPIREADSMDLKRASVELLAPRSPMAKETMLTFSNTLPRASMAANGGLGPSIGHDETGQLVQPVAPVQRRLKAVPVPVDPTRSQQTRTLDPVLSQLSLVSEWKQNLSREETERDTSEESSETGTEEGPIYTTAMHAGRSDPSPVYQTAVHCGRSGSRRNTPTPPLGGAKPVATPRPPQVCDAPPISPKSAMTRAKWLAIREKATGGEGATPRLMQVVAMTKQQQRLRPSSSSETGSTCSDSPHYGNQRHSDAIVTVDAHAPHHPVVKTTAAPPNDSARDVTPRQATPPNVIHRQATPPNVIHRQATPPNVIHRGATPPNVIHRQATPPNVTHTHHHPVINPLPAQPVPPNSHRGATPPNVTHTQQALHRKTPPPNASHRGATPPNTLAPPLAPPPWEWAGSNGSDPRDSYDLNSLTRGDSAARGSSFRPASRSASPRDVGVAYSHDMGVAYSHDMGVAYSRDMGVAYSRDTSCMGVSYPEGEESPADAHRREMAMRRKTALVLLDREIRSQAQQESYYKSLQPRRYKD